MEPIQGEAQKLLMPIKEIRITSINKKQEILEVNLPRQEKVVSSINQKASARTAAQKKDLAAANISKRVDRTIITKADTRIKETSHTKNTMEMAKKEKVDLVAWAAKEAKVIIITRTKIWEVRVTTIIKTICKEA